MKKHIPSLVAASILSAATLVLIWLILKKNNGDFVYPLDDTYIHLAVAKNLWFHHSWGVNPGDWVSASSSPLYTLLLGLSYGLSPSPLYAPILLAWIGAFGIILALSRELRHHYATLSNGTQTLILLATLFLAVIPLMIIVGMEHALQTATTLFFVFHAANRLEKPEQPADFKIWVWGALMVSLRYENIFIVAVVCLLLWWRRGFKEAFLTGFFCILPIVLFGLLFWSKGGFPIPNSVLIKGNSNMRSVLGGQAAIPSLAGSLGGLLLIASVLIFNSYIHQKWSRPFFVLTIFVFASLLHGVFAQFGWYYRYETYLITLGVFQLLTWAALSFQPSWLKDKTKWVIGILFILLSSNIMLRSLNATLKTPAIVHNIYGQQFQMGRFIQHYYPKGRIAANDIGALAYYGDIYLLDMWGLASNEVTKARRGGYWSNEFLQKQVADKNIELVIIYDSWFDKNISQPWIKVAEWIIPNNIICGDDQVSFYATSVEAAQKLKKNLQSFEKEQPSDNQWKYFFHDPSANLQIK